MTLAVVKAALDTLEVSYTGSLGQGQAERLDALKTQAQVQNCPAPVQAGVYELFMKDKAFGHWRWRLTHPEFSLVMLPNPRPGQPSAQVRLSAFGLANQDPSLLLLFAANALSQFGTFEELVVSRADVCVDFQGFVPTVEAMTNGVVCPASFRPIYPNLESAETFQFGKGTTVVRVYDKLQELEVSDKRCLIESWQIGGHYDPSLPVWRFEAQVRRPDLKRLGLSSSKDVFDNLGALLDYGLEWANLRVPNGDKTKTRWPEHPAWSELRSAVFDGTPLLRSPTPATLLSLDSATSRFLSSIGIVGARYGIHDYTEAVERAWWLGFIELRERDIEFSDFVESYRRKILAGS